MGKHRLPRRDDRVPPPDHYKFVRRIKGTEHRWCCVLSDALEGYWSHWDGHRTVACTREETDEGELVGECDGCETQQPRKWRGFLHVIGGLRFEEEFILEMPAGCATQLRNQTHGENSLRGLRVEVWRTSTSPQAHYRLICHPRINLAAHLPPGKEIREHVARLWAVQPSKLRKTNGRADA